ncbi:unnamed protein product, partial [Allacma fusca]
MIGII